MTGGWSYSPLTGHKLFRLTTPKADAEVYVLLHEGEVTFLEEVEY